MKILIVASYNKQHFAPFIVEQVEALEAAGVVCAYFGVVGKGILGYLKNLKALKQKIKEFNPNIIYAHFGLCGLLANLQRTVPVVTTYHGSDINVPNVLMFSKWAMRLSAFNIFVSQKNVDLAGVAKKYALIPCGVNMDLFHPMNKQEAREKIGLDKSKTYILFSSSFDNAVKNPNLAKKSVNLLSDAELLELKGYTREQVNVLLNAVDCVLMTSYTEGSPQFIKEAMAVGCPIVSVDVGDVKERIDGLDGCYIADRTPEDVVAKLKTALEFKNKTEGRQAIIKQGLDNKRIARKLMEVYQKIESNSTKKAHISYD